jgi:PiT family inorganic phosphate transporter
VGAALVSTEGRLNGSALGKGFALPLLTSPLASALLGWILIRFARSDPACVCVESVIVPGAESAAARPTLAMDSEIACDARGADKIVSGRRFEAGLHVLSAGAVSFARGLNDIPKIAGILLIAPFISWNGWMLVLLGLVMAIGGLLGSARVGRTMSSEITPMTDRQALLANLVTSSLVIGASAFGLPVSTTHVACGSLAGLGLCTGKLAVKRLAQILAAWVITLPAAAALACLFLRIVH